MSRPAIVALDLFAGTGWGVACHWLGIDEVGVELMPEAVATREANGMHTAYRDVWDGLDGDEPMPEHSLLIASPPCQTFSMAGGGAGRKALDEVLSLIDSKAYLHPHMLREFGERHDPRTALVLTPLAYVARHAPMYVVLEQVPPVLPVWERMATELRGWGYSVVTGNLQAEQYGVPQTRKRAVLIARADGREAVMPTPTHSAYYSRNPGKLDEGVKPWVSMAEALGWGMTERPYLTVSSGTEAGGGTDPAALGGSGARRTVDRERGAGRWAPEGRVVNLDPSKPATTVQGDPRLTAREHHYHGQQNGTSTRVTADEAAALQSYPPGFEWVGSKTATFRQIGNAVPPLLARAILATLLDDPEPAPDPRGAAFSAAAPRGPETYRGNQKPGGTGDYQRRSTTEPSPSITSGSRSAFWETAPDDEAAS